MDVSQAIREPEVTDNIHHVADNLLVREALVLLQRQLAQVGNVVTEGRDQGTVAFPAAECKFFLTASPQERARRRSAQLQEQGIEADAGELRQCLGAVREFAMEEERALSAGELVAIHRRIASEAAVA